MGQFERYSDDELRLIAGFMKLATLALQRHADRIEQLRPDRPGQAQPGDG
jgi:hypothetical protein